MKHLSFFTCILLIGLLGCNEECELVEEKLDPVEDLVAFLDPNQFVNGNVLLYYKPGYLQDVIAQLGAVQDSGNVYRMQAPTVDGADMVEVLFVATPVSQPFQFVTDDSPDEIVAKHKVYKNAKCKETLEAFTEDDCTKIEDRYYNTEYLGWNECKRGTGFCLEIKQVIGIRRWYEDTLCSVLVDTEPLKAFHCKK